MAKHSDVLLGYLHPNEVTASFHKSLLDLIGHDLSGPRRLRSWAMVKCGTNGIPAGRNDLVKKFLATDCEWLFMVDADMGFEPHTLDALLSCADKDERPIIGGLAFAQRESMPDGFNGFKCFPQPTLLEWLKHEDGHSRFTGRAHYPVNSLVKTGATGAAMLLIHRTSLERVQDEYGENWFEPVPDPNGTKMGEDISFFVRTQSLDIPLFVHTGIRTTHYKHLWLAEDDFWTSFIAPPATERVDVLIPVLNRPQNVAPLMESLRASTGLATAYFVVEDGDESETKAVLENGGVVLSSPDAHTFAQKINYAFSATMTTQPEKASPWILLCGDDVRFRPGWLDHAQDVARRYNADVIGTNDLLNPRVTRGEHATHPMVRRTYCVEQGASWDAPGVVCHEGYSHWCVDDEIVTVAKQRGIFQAALGSQVEHIHPINGHTPTDEIYALGEKNSKADQKLFEKRYFQNQK